MSGIGLPVQNLVSVSITLSPIAAAQRDFGVLLIVGDSNVIDTTERYREYSSLGQVAEDFGSSASEYLAATIFFSQNPRPDVLLVGRWARTATAGRLYGPTLTPAQQTAMIAALSGIDDGAYNISLDGAAAVQSDPMDFTGATNMNAIAAIIDQSRVELSCTWDATRARFVVQRTGTGPTSSLSAFFSPATGTDVSFLLELRDDDGVSFVQGIAAQNALDTALLFMNLTVAWYGLMFASSVQPSSNDYLSIAAAIEAASPNRILGLTSNDTAILNPSSTSDIAFSLKAFGYNRTFVQYSSGSLYSVAGIFGRAFTVDFQGNNTTITLMFKQEVGVVAETLTQTQASAVKAKNCNVFVRYNNGTAIIQFGRMSGGQYFDVIHGTDWLADSIQTGIYNLLYQSTTKIPLTDEGVHQIMSVVESVLTQGVVNGLIAPGVWNGGAFGVMTSGQFLTKGFYTFAPPVSSLTASQRSARQAPSIQCAINLGNAVHEASVAITVNS